MVEPASDAPEDIPSWEHDGVGSRGLDGLKGVLVCRTIALKRAKYITV